MKIIINLLGLDNCVAQNNAITRNDQILIWILRITCYLQENLNQQQAICNFIKYNETNKIDFRLFKKELFIKNLLL